MPHAPAPPHTPRSSSRPSSSRTTSFLSRLSSRRSSSDDMKRAVVDSDDAPGGACLTYLLHSPASAAASAGLRLYLRFLFRGRADAPSARAFSGSREERGERGEEVAWCEVRRVDEARWF